ncbi:MAG: DUF3769 domain-containing protein, partial [Cyanobacteria bacterium J06632_3]
ELPSLGDPGPDPEEGSVPPVNAGAESPQSESSEAERTEAESPEAESPEADELEAESQTAPVQVEFDADSDVEDEASAFAAALRLSADQQDYNSETQIITARGNVLLRLNDAVIEANELWVNLVNRYALAEGDVLLTRGAQFARGSRLEYNFIQRAGVVNDAVGTILLPALDEDLSSPLDGPSSSPPVYDPVNGIRDFSVRGDGSIQVGTRLSTQIIDDNAPEESAEIRQLRFETDVLSFGIEGWRADAVRITNDPFSPPELELRTDSLVLRNLSPTQDELLLKRPRLVFDQGLSLPLLRSRILLNRGGVNPDDISPTVIPVGIDGRDRGGLFLGRSFPIINNGRTRLSVSPQYFLNRAFSSESDSPIDLNNFGAAAKLRSQLSPRTVLRGGLDVTGLNPSDLSENIRASLRVEQQIGDHRLSLQSSYRERLFNGSLGFQDVQASLGAVLLSPVYTLGDTGLRLSYQASAQWINAESDRADLLAARGSETGRVSLGRYQGSVALSRDFDLWRGEPITTGPYQGLRYTPEPVVPYLQLETGARVTSTYYSSGDNQNNLLARVGLEAQLGHFLRNFGDYTRLNLGYTQSFLGEANSPFLFDRTVDRNVLSMGITQQLYGPFLVGFETALSFDGGEPINTIYTLEYSRRTYGLLLRYDTTQNTGSIGFRLSNFNWIGDTNPFTTPRVRNVQGGVLEND